MKNKLINAIRTVLTSNRGDRDQIDNGL